MNKRSEIRYFAQADLWSRSAVSEQLAVAEDLIQLIPESVTTILDAGCGNGTVTNQLRSRWDVVGCDISEAAVKHVQAPALVADLCAIPFADRRFDLVLSSDVIEHLPDAIYAQALAEIARVSARYILVAVPYRELLEAAEITCPGCGLRYHAHLHQRSYTIADAVSLFAPAFTAIDVRFSGESWTFEDPDLVEASRTLSGLDYPFEDGVCPQCSTRRGSVEQSSAALMVQRRFEALQAMQVAEGKRNMPDSSEIIVLFERGGASTKNWITPGSVEPFSDSRLLLASLVLRENPTNYPRVACRIKGDADYGIVTIPRRPHSVCVTGGQLAALEVYDHVRRSYVSCPKGQKADSYLLAAVPFGPHGCILRMLHPSEDLQLQLSFANSDQSAIIACCLGDDPAIVQMQENFSELSTLAEHLEFTRSDLEIKLQEKERDLAEQTQTIATINALANELEGKRAEIEDRFTQLSTQAACQEELVSANVLRIDALLHENQLVCSRSTALQEKLDEVVAHSAAYSQRVEELTLKLEQMNGLANALEARREALERQQSVHLLELGQLTSNLDDMTALANDLEARREALERQQGGHLLELEQLARNLDDMTALANSLEARRDALEKVQVQHLLQLQQMAEDFAGMSELANTLELHRDALEQQLQVRDQQLVNLQTQYDAVLSNNEHLSERANSLELKQYNFVSIIEALDSQVNQAQIVVLEHQSAMARIDVLEMEKTTLRLELESLNMEILARSHELVEQNRVAESLKELSTRLENQREALEAKVSDLGQTIDSLVDEKTEYQMLLDALHIHLGQGRQSDARPPRKVLILSHMYPREYNMVGGIFVHEQVKALRARGIDARVVSGEPFWINTLNPKIIKRALGIYRTQKTAGWEDHDGVPLIRFPYVVSSLLPFQAHATTYSHGLLRQAAWLHADFPFELIHAHTAYTDGTAGRRLARKFNVPLVITEHTGPFTTLTRTGYLRRTTQKALNAADYVIAVSSALLSDIQHQVKLKPDINARVIANLVDTDLFKEQARQSDELIHLLWVGHFVPVKRVPVLIEAFAIAYEVEPRLRLRLVGSGEGLEHAQALVESLGVAHVVEFSGRANRAQLVDFYGECDFLVVSSESETFGVVAIEAMSCGRPVLTTRCGGPAEIVSHPQLGEVVDMSVEALTQGMLSMAGRLAGFDSKVIRRVTELRFSSSSIAQEIADVYSTSIDKHTG
jgi:glycosyltransferase involved in cell wall biosynthesis/SAM-dependent methyltransferase